MQSQKVSDQCGVSAVRPEPFDHSSPGVFTLIKARSLLFPEQFDAGLAGGFYDIRQQGMSEPPQFMQQPLLRISQAHLVWNIS
jgi:hypothetical protein